MRGIAPSGEPGRTYEELESQSRYAEKYAIVLVSFSTIPERVWAESYHPGSVRVARVRRNGIGSNRNEAKSVAHERSRGRIGYRNRHHF